jgi:hypothetical protein
VKITVSGRNTTSHFNSTVTVGAMRQHIFEMKRVLCQMNRCGRKFPHQIFVAILKKNDFDKSLLCGTDLRDVHSADTRAAPGEQKETCTSGARQTVVAAVLLHNKRPLCPFRGERRHIMFKNLTRLITTTLVVGSLTAGATAQPKADDEIFSRLLTVAVGNEIREKCPTIEARTIAATLYFLGILNYARSIGFTKDQMFAYRDDPKNQESLRKATYAYLDKHGVNRAVPASYCTLGTAEIAQNSETGKLLKRR